MPEPVSCLPTGWAGATALFLNRNKSFGYSIKGSRHIARPSGQGIAKGCVYRKFRPSLFTRVYVQLPTLEKLREMIPQHPLNVQSQSQFIRHCDVVN